MCALVTGVQTCALPICPSNRSTIMSQLSFSSFDDALLVRDAQGRYSPASVDQILEAARQAIELKMQRGAEFTRSAERRVGKECVSTVRFRGRQYHSKTKRSER